MFKFEEMGSDKISTSLTLDSSYKIRVNARSDAQNMFPLLNMMRRVSSLALFVVVFDSLTTIDLF